MSDSEMWTYEISGDLEKSLKQISPNLLCDIIMGDIYIPIRDWKVVNDALVNIESHILHVLGKDYVGGLKSKPGTVTLASRPYAILQLSHEPIDKQDFSKPQSLKYF